MTKIPNLVEYIDALFDKRAQAQGRMARSVHASAIGFPCARALAYDQVVPSEPTTGELQKIFALGNVLEDQAVVVFAEAVKGTDIDIIRDRMPMPQNRYGIGGKVDWWVAFTNEDGVRVKFPAEFKTMSPFTYNSIHTLADMMNHSSPWVRKYPAQLLCYMALSCSENGVFILMNKVNGQYKQINVTLDDDALQYVETLFKRAESVTDAVALYRQAQTTAEQESAMPERMPFDPTLCPNCSHYRRCIPNIKQAGSVVIDPLWEGEVEAWCNILAQTEEAAKQHDEANDKLLAHCKAMCNEVPQGESKTMITQTWYVTGKVGKPRATYDIPDDVKAKYRKLGECSVTKRIKRIDGSDGQE